MRQKKYRHRAIMIYAAFLLTVAIFLLLIYFRFPGVIIALNMRYARWRAGLSRHEVQVDDHRWVYLTGGEGDAVILVHGFGGDKDRWGSFLTHFDCKRYQVIAPDLPGFGENSRLSAASYDVPNQVKRLHRFAQTMNLTSFHLMGVSMGGCIAGYYASEYPDQVKSLVLIDAAGIQAPEPSDMARFQKESKRNILIVNFPEQFTELNTFMYHSPLPIPATFFNYFSRQAVADSQFNRKIYSDLKDKGDALLEDRLSDIIAPTLVIWGAQDRVFHVSSVDVFQKKINNCQTAIIEQCGHLPYLEKPEKTRKLFWHFIEGIH